MKKKLILKKENLLKFIPLLLKNNFHIHMESNDVAKIEVDGTFSLSMRLKEELFNQGIDWALIPERKFSDLGLIVSDMDSTFITIECIDEIADKMGIKGKISQITERAMKGELDFEASLRERVALLEGLAESELEVIFQEKVKLSPGVEYFLSECKKNAVKFLLVSGGFSFFTERLRKQFNLDYAFANTLEIIDGKLTGHLQGKIIDAEAKSILLEKMRKKLNLNKNQVLAVGDGANDILMLEKAGIAVAYHAKTVTKKYSTFNIDFSGMEFIRDCFQ